MTATDSPHLVGHRLIRRIGSGERAELFLGAPDNGGEGVALKVFRPAVTLDSINTELAALGRSRAPHAVRLDDVATGPDGRPIAILRRLPRASLARLVTERDAIELGEAVTALAPIVATVALLHRSGVVHSSLGPASVLFGARGEPMLIGFGHAKLIEPGLSIAALDTLPEILAERTRLARFVAGGLERARPGDAQRPLRDLVGWLGDEQSTLRFEFLEELEQRLFDLAVPIPISFSPTPGVVAVPGRVEGADSPSANATAPGVGALRTAHSTRRDLRLAETMDRALRSSPRAFLMAKLRAVAGSVRRPLWIGLGVTVTLLILALSLVPAGNAAHPRDATQRAIGSTTAASSQASSRVSSPPTSAQPSAAHPTSAAQPVAAGSADALVPVAASAKTAPVLALPGLLSHRAVCFRDRSLGCLDAVDAAESSALATDSTSIQALQRGGETTPSRTVSDVEGPTLTAGTSVVRLVEGLGDAAIVSVDVKATAPKTNGTTALVLMMNTRAGWRIRGFLDHTAVRP